MKNPIAVFTSLLLALLLASSGHGAVRFGVTEDAGKYADDGGVSFFATLNDLGMTENRIAVFWDAAHPTEIQERAFLDRSLPVAAAAHVQIVFSVQPLHPTDVTSTPGGARQFADYVALLARTYPQVKEFIIGNEPNQPRFWRPQFSPRGRGLAAAAYEQMLALSYDALKSVDPAIDVIGLGLSPRGNDDPRARSNVSTSPVRFIHDLGVAYRASGRTRPIMDELAFHPYPNPSSANDPLLKGYQWPNAGVPNFARIKQAVWDALAGTAQPTFAEGGGGSPLLAAPAVPPPLTLVLDETGWQARIPASARSAYTGRESSQTVDEATQARIYGDLVRFVECDPAVTALNLFHLVDESDLDRFQTGLIRADSSRRPSYDAVKDAIAETAGVCSGAPVVWRHSTAVAGSAASFGRRRSGGVRSGFGITAKEAARFRAGIFRVRGGRGVVEGDRSWIGDALASNAPRPGLVSRSSGSVRAYSTRDVTFRPRSLAPGWYVYAVRLAASMNPARTSVLVGSPFRVR
ncbi:MAG TPA: hypothetical protein VE596_17650 [Gaiellaceae bacterium]|nr:hypothetical protein [Gaiellaceae bacterium]